jgi:hypothetical protein
MAMSDDLQGLRCQVDAATGADRELDRAIARVLGRVEPAPDYTASVDRCLDLVQACLPGWAWHVGWNASGVLPYATLHGGEHLVAAAGPTVPLALLRALLAGLAARDASEQEVAGQEAG